MKKYIAILSAAVALIASVALVGCSGAVSADTTNIVEKLDAPAVTAKAYPGFIRLTWDKVNGASSYKIYRDGAYKGTVLNGAKTEFIDPATKDNNLLNGITYKYQVVAFAGDDVAYAQDNAATANSNNTARAGVYFQQSEAVVSEKANVPKIAEFDEYYKDYFAKFTAAETAMKTELVSVNDINYIKVTAPTVPEFKYEVSIYVDNTPGNISDKNTLNAFEVETENATEFFRPVSSSGSWNVSVKVIPVSELYSAKSFAGSKAEVAGLPIDTVWSTQDANESNITGRNVTGGTRDVNATYKTATSVRIKFVPATYNGIAYAASDYAVYRFYKNTYTKVAGDIKEFKVGDIDGSNVITQATYYIDDDITAAPGAGQYHVVLSKNGLFEKAHWGNESGAADVNIQNIVWTGDYSLINTGSDVSSFNAAYIDLGKTIRVKFHANTSTDTTAMYTVYRKLNSNSTGLNSKTELVKLGELKDTTETSIRASDGKVTQTKIFYVDDTITDNTVDYLYLIYRTENGSTRQIATRNAEAYSVNSVAAQPAFIYSTGSTSPDVRANDKDGLVNDVWVKFKLGKLTDTFVLYRAKVNDNNVVLDSDFTTVTGYQFGATTTTFNANTKEFVLFDANLEKGTYKYRLVESEEGKNSSAVETTVVINNDTTVGGFGVAWDSINHKIVISDSYDDRTETPGNYTYSYQVVKKTTNTANPAAGEYVYADEAAVAVTLAQYNVYGNIHYVKNEVIRGITATSGVEYQVIATKKDSKSGKEFYAVAGWTSSN